MVFTQGSGFVVGLFGLPCCLTSVTRFGFHTAETASLATWFLFGKLSGVRRLLASMRSGVVKPSVGPPQSIQCAPASNSTLKLLELDALPLAATP